MAVRNSRLTADDWTAAALTALAEGGLAAVAVEPLALRLGATKGSFYHHFSTRDALIEAALRQWETERTEEIIVLVEQAGEPREQLSALLERVLPKSRRDGLEAQILAAADHPLVAGAVRRVVERRIGYTISLLERAGLPPREAAARGVLLYTAYTGHDQLLARLPQSLPLSAAGGRAGYLRAVFDLVLGGVPATTRDQPPSGSG